jgi:hypothetical protein
MMARATHLVVRVGSAALQGGFHFSDEVIISIGAFVLGQVLNFGSLAYVADYYGELQPLKETPSVDNRSLASCHLPSLLGVDLKVLAR